MKEKISEQEKKERRGAAAASYPILGVILILGSLAFTVFRFGAVTRRVLQSLKDLGKSALYYFTDMLGIYGAVQPTVTEIPSEMPSLLPIEWEEFKEKCNTLFLAIFDKKNFTEFNIWLAEWAARLMPYVYFLGMIILIIWLIKKLSLKLKGKPKRWSEESEERQETLPLRAWLKIERGVISPTYRYVKSFAVYIREKRIYRITLILIWLYNFNLFTIFLETFAYAFYFPIAAIDSVNGVKAYSQVVKFAIDISVPLGFLPWWLKAYIGLVIFDKWRRRVGDRRLEKKDEKNEELLNENPGTIFLTGKPRSGKGIIGTDMVLKQETTFREIALEQMHDCKIEFPYFPWDRLERFMRQAIDRHVLYTKEGVRDFIDSLKYMREHENEQDEKVKELFGYRLKEFCGYEYADYMFGYEWKRYGEKFNNGIVTISIYETLVDYAQLYYVYDAPNSLIFSTQGVRVDFKRETLGYFPKYDLDYLKRDPEEAEKISTYSHRKNYDSERLGRSMKPDDPIKNGYEIAISYDPEIDKERGNQNTNAGVKADDIEVNPKNDLYNVEEKMHNHSTTIRYVSYYRKIMDSQRNGAVSSDITEMALEFRIVESKKPKVELPFFGLEKWMYEKLAEKYNATDEEASYTGKTRTLFAYLARRIYMPIARRYVRMENAYGTQEKVLHITNGQGGETIAEKAVWTVIFRRARAKRYSTDGILGLYRKRVVHRSEGGMNDFSLFEGIRNTGDEFQETNSIFYTKFPKYFNGEYEAERQRKLLEKQLKEIERAEKEKQTEEEKEEEGEKKKSEQAKGGTKRQGSPTGASHI